jgi:DNA-directed RNA polymerase specialized sigma24 family protein
MEESEAFVRARSAALLRTAYLLTGDRQLAEDLLQECLARLAQHWANIRRNQDPEPYARRILYRRAVDTWRARRSRVTETLAATPPDQLTGASWQVRRRRRGSAG